MTEKDAIERTAKKTYARVLDYKRTFTSKSGKNVLHDLMDAHQMLRPSFDPDPYRTAFREGERSVLLRILTIMKTEPAQLLAHIEEIQKNATTE